MGNALLEINTAATQSICRLLCEDTPSVIWLMLRTWNLNANRVGDSGSVPVHSPTQDLTRTLWRTACGRDEPSSFTLSVVCKLTAQ